MIYKTLEWFSGSKSFSKFMNERGSETCTIDNNIGFSPDICDDVKHRIIPHNTIGIFWASPPCQGFSVASIGKHWTGGKGAYIPKSDTSKLGLELLEHTIKSIAESKPLYWFIENPRGVMRKVIDKIFQKYGITDYKRVTVCYCRYGDSRMKPTDIWTNLKDWDGRMCHNGNDDHEKAPRGSKTGTQGLKGAYDRGKIPQALFEEILNVIESRTRSR